MTSDERAIRRDEQAERSGQAEQADAPREPAWDPQEARRLIDDLPRDLEWDGERADAGEQEDSGDYVDGFNDGIEHARAIAAQLRLAIDLLAARAPSAAPTGPAANSSAARPPTGIDALTRREHEVVGLLAQGLSNKQIADRLGISEYTAKFHVHGAMMKLRSTTRTELVVEAVRQGVIQILPATEAEVAARRGVARPPARPIRTRAKSRKKR